MNPAARIDLDEAARERIKTSLDESLIVEASAGTGKTTALVGRIVAVLASGRTSVDKIAAVTFTNKAAGELKLRLRAGLDKARHDNPASAAALEHALEHLEEASIGTIHSFCAQLLRERPVEADVDPSFEELTEPEANRLYQRSFRAWMERRLGTNSPGLRRALARLSFRDSWDDAPAMEKLQWAGRKLVEWRDYPAPWRRMPFERDEEASTLVRMLRDLASMSSQPRRVTDNLYKTLAPARALADWIARSESAGPRDYDTLEARLLKCARDLRKSMQKGSGEYGGGVSREALLEARDEFLRWVEEFRRRADADLAASLRDEMQGLVEEYQARKRRGGKLDFVDLLIRARDLVRDKPDVRKHLQERYSHLFIDEFQDTDPLQAEILMLLCGSDAAEQDWLKTTPAPGKMFLVGDPKQSIYKFRRADIVLYRQVRDGLESRGVGVVKLSKSFRSVRNIQNFVNAAFDTEMETERSDSPAHAEWSPLEKHREDYANYPSVIALPVPKPYARVNVAVDPVKESLIDAIGAWVAWLIQKSEWKKEDGSAYRERDVAVLFRKRNHGATDLTRELARALEARGVAHLLAGSKTFHHREEVETLRAALTAIEWPDDELNVYAALKGPLFAIPDETLLLWHEERGGFHPFKASEAKGMVAEAMEILRDLHRRRNSQAFAVTVNQLLEATRAHATFLLRPGGQQILANVMRVADLARTYETSGGISFRGFVEELIAQAEKEEAAEAPVLEEDSDGVRLMTVHSAKGLEFPVVILADLMTHISRREPEVYIDPKERLCAAELLGCLPWELLEHAGEEAERERAEGVRVAYVAATRAKDLLVVPAVGDREWPENGWLTPLSKALFPARGDWRRSERAPQSCPEFGKASIVYRPPEAGPGEEISVRPGLIRPHSGSHEVVWWDPNVLKLGEQGKQGLVKQEALADDGGASSAEYLKWRSERDELLARASRPSRVVLLASQTRESPPGETLPVEFVATAAARATGGRRFGALVHAAMRDVALDANEDAVRSALTLNARVLGATAEEVDAALGSVTAALAHPVIARARGATRTHREYPILLPLDETRVLEGVIDLAYLRDDVWTIVDFKTDAHVEEKRSAYERQLRWYAFALKSITGYAARAVLMSV